MPAQPPSPATRRLLACVEAFAHEEEGAIHRDDWPALAAILERELEVICRLGLEQNAAPAEDAATLARAEALRSRYAALGERVDQARARAELERAELKRNSRRLRSVRGAYSPPSRGPDDSTHHAAA